MALTYPLVRINKRIKVLSYEKRFFHPPNPAIITSYPEFKFTLDDRVTLGQSPNNWSHLISIGANAGSGLVGKRTRLKPGGGGCYVSNSVTHGWDSAAGEGLGALPPLTNLPGALPLAGQLASEKLLGSYLNATKKWRGGNFLVEFSETVHMLRHPIVSLFGKTQHFVKGVREIRHLSPEPYRKKLGRLWIGYSFGWKPLFEDIKDANKALDALSAGTGHDVIGINGSGSDVKVTSSNPNQPTYEGQGEFDTYSITEQRVKYYGAIRARPESFATVADTFGVEPDDILPAVWEAIPWSFFIDYFLNVQQVIDSWRYAHASLAWLMQGTKASVRFVGTGWRPKPISSIFDVSMAVNSSESRVDYLGRNVINSIPYPPFRFKIPGLQSLKWVNTAALIAQIAASRPPSR